MIIIIKPNICLCLVIGVSVADGSWDEAAVEGEAAAAFGSAVHIDYTSW